MYRKIDVDTLTVEDDQFMEQEFKFTPEQVQAQTTEKESNVKQALARNDFATALKHALINPPYGPAEVETLKSLCDDLVYQSIAPVKQTEIVKLIKNLSSDEADLLVKYTYKLMAKPSVFNPAILLSWHEKLIAETGHGAIVRCLTDRCQLLESSITLLDNLTMQITEYLDKGDDVISKIDIVLADLGLERKEYPKQPKARYLEAQADLLQLQQLRDQRQLEVNSLNEEITNFNLLLGTNFESRIIGLTPTDLRKGNETVAELSKKRNELECLVERTLLDLTSKMVELEGYLPIELQEELERIEIIELLEDDSILTVDYILANELTTLLNEVNQIDKTLQGRLERILKELNKLAIDLQDPIEEDLRCDLKMLGYYESLAVALRQKYKLKMSTTILKSFKALEELWNKLQVPDCDRRHILEMLERGNYILTKMNFQ